MYSINMLNIALSTVMILLFSSCRHSINNAAMIDDDDSCFPNHPTRKLKTLYMQSRNHLEKFPKPTSYVFKAVVFNFSFRKQNG